MADLGNDLHGVELAHLAERMRTMVTPVIGYLELISQMDRAEAANRHQWIATIERRMSAMHELNDQISRACAALQDPTGEAEPAAAPVA